MDSEEEAEEVRRQEVHWSVISASSLPCTGLEPPDSSLRLTDVGVCTPSEGTDNKVSSPRSRSSSATVLYITKTGLARIAPINGVDRIFKVVNCLGPVFLTF